MQLGLRGTQWRTVASALPNGPGQQGMGNPFSSGGLSSSLQGKPARPAPGFRKEQQEPSKPTPPTAPKPPPQPIAPRGKSQPQQSRPRPAMPASKSPPQGASQGKQSAAAVPTRVLGVDYGTKWTGLAYGDAGRCSELEVLQNDQESVGRGMFARVILQKALDLEAGGVVVGLPLDPWDSKSTLTNPSADSLHGRRCRHFAHSLALVARPHGLSVYLYDEASTSSDALRVAGLSGFAKREGFGTTKERLDKKVDTLSAMLLLQRFYAKPGRAVKVVVRASAPDDEDGEDGDKEQEAKDKEVAKGGAGQGPPAQEGSRVQAQGDAQGQPGP